MAELFTSIYNKRREISKSCMFSRLGNCSNFVHESICNNHSSKIFGLFYMLRDFTDGTGHHFQRIETYYSNIDTSFEIPLFTNNLGTILAGQIYTFAQKINRIINPRPELVDYIANTISAQLGVSAYNLDKCPPVNGWLGNDLGGLFIFDGDVVGSIPLQNLRPLHKILFKYTYPKIQMSANVPDDSLHRYENMILSKNNLTGESTFVMTNHRMVLKYTNRQDCVMTPIVLAGVAVTGQRREEQNMCVSQIPECPINAYYA